jgi:hypothetical protein
MGFSNSQRVLIVVSFVVTGLRGFVEFIEATWSLFSNEPLVPTLAAQVGVTSMPYVAVATTLAPVIGLAILVYALFIRKPASSERRASVGGMGASDRPASLVLEGRRRDGLEVHKAFNPWRVRYPLHLVNASDAPIDIVGYNLNLLLDDSPVGRVEWRAPDAEANNGLPLLADQQPVPAYTIQPGKPYTLSVPINRKQIGDLPRGNPTWGAKGNIYLRVGADEKPIPFDFSTDHYQLDQWDWTQWAGQ